MVKTWSWDDAFSVALLALMCALAGYAIASVQLLAAALYLLFAGIAVGQLAVIHSRRRNRRAR